MERRQQIEGRVIACGRERPPAIRSLPNANANGRSRQRSECEFANLGTEKVLYDFSNEDGSPSAGVIRLNGDLYGMTFGSFEQDDFGEVFKLGTAGGPLR
jgi:hypothetical protein